MFLVQGSIFFKGPIPLLPSVTSLGKIFLRASRHVVDVAGYQVMIVNEPESQSPITMLLIRFEVRPCVQYLEYCNHIFPNQRSVGNERVGKWNDFFRVSFKHRSTTENRSLSDHILIVCKLLASISAVRGITCSNRSYQITPQPISEGLPIYSAKSSHLLFQRFQGLVTVPWIYGRYSFGVLLCLLRVLLIVHSADLGEINICVCARVPNPF